ncbi:MAG: prephenate dehydrogenase [Chloroflexota bacterium]
MNAAILGLGLIGGSLGLALRRAGWPVRGWSPHAQTVALALKLGAIDQPAESIADAVASADLVVLAGPIRTLRELLRATGQAAPAGCVITDVASVKGQVMRWAEQELPAGAQFLGGHPMAGSDRQGVAAASVDLFTGCTYCLVPTSERTLAVGQQLAAAVHARPRVLMAAEHDAAVAAVSHLPFVVAAALVQSVESDLAGLAGELAASGFRDTTRVAAGSVEMHADICHYNAAVLLEHIERFEAALRRVKAQLSALPEGSPGPAVRQPPPPELDALFQAARAARLEWDARREAAKP